ncbi:PAS domain-containing protein [Halorubrum kocurii]|uniref:Histidine kinase n=1 Tax=Halorubrum kocurii JCM 14978 TaxID=1230456 RepID=M0P7I5_9EURY|nr:PAS domain-containing protein [Halorubrum kocurii]EMA64800.1 histidine kinase [Halorubrum kocurii JCM 14978]
MAFDSEGSDTGVPSGGSSAPDGEARVLLCMRPGRDRDLVAETLGERYRIETATEPAALDAAFDCCVLDARAFDRAVEEVDRRRERAEPVFLPFVLLVPDAGGEAARNPWEHVDDVVELPVQRGALRSRVANLVERRRTALRLADRERRLEAAVEELREKERAMDEAPVGITLAEPGSENKPLTYVNEEFERLTGYGPEMLGKDCRFLQGEGTNPETVATIREAIDDERPVSVDILNYRANGQKFWNQLTVAPIRDETGAVIRYVGFQTDITERKLRERRLEVMGRVLNHNLRNKMNLIEGYTELLRAEPDEEERRRSLDVVADTTDDLMRIAETVRKIDHTFSEGGAEGVTVNLRDRFSELLSQMSDRYPDATFDLSLPDDDLLTVSVVGIQTAIDEAVENAVKHNDAPSPRVWIRVERGDEEWIEIEIEDDGPGIPEHETHVLDRGETSLKHADRLGIWLMYWVVSKAGGEFSVESLESGGTLLRMAVPADP